MLQYVSKNILNHCEICLDVGRHHFSTITEISVNKYSGFTENTF
jgi:hypothetical protein